MSPAARINNILNETIGKSDKLALLLDYDGTLSPIQPRPELAFLPAETRKILQKIVQSPNIYCAIISGRQADNAKNIIAIDNLTYAGSHGFEIIYPDGSRYTHTVPESEQEKMRKIGEELKDLAVEEGAFLENKGNAMTYHYRAVNPERRISLIAEVKDIVRKNGLVPSDAIYGIEFQPAIKWNKGYVGEYLLKNKFGEDWNNKAKAIFIGDDTTDEKLMELCKGRITTFRVASSDDVVTSADFKLSSLEEVVMVLQWVENNYC